MRKKGIPTKIPALTCHRISSRSNEVTKLSIFCTFSQLFLSSQFYSVTDIDMNFIPLSNSAFREITKSIRTFFSVSLFLLFILAEPHVLKAQETPKILFLTFKIIKAKGTEAYQIQLLNKTIVAGKLKSEAVPSHVSEKLVFAISDAQEQLIKSLEIDNPLSVSIESFSPDGTMQRHAAAADSAEFTVRFRYTGMMKKLTLQSQNKRAKTQGSTVFTMDL